MGQAIQLGDELILCNTSLRDVIDPQEFQSYMHERYIPAWSRAAGKSEMFLLKADRGDKNGDFLIATVLGMEEHSSNKNSTPGALFSLNVDGLSEYPSDYMTSLPRCTKYQLIGAAKLEKLPKVDLLGIHYIKVKPTETKKFEQLVAEKLHPTVGNLVHDMNLLYYKAIDGVMDGSYITIYAIESQEARERFWPTGGHEQDIVKELFKPYQDLALELGAYLEADSYLGPESGGGAAYFESLEWTDYSVLNPSN